MRKITKKIIVWILTFLAKRMLLKHQPEIIAITGSVGKTGTKACISRVLSKRFRVLSPQKSYNTEIGIPLAIFNEEVPCPLFSLKGWVKLIFRMTKKLLFKRKYYQKLILEIGADAPGDVKHLVNFIKPKISIITNIGSAHLVNFKDTKSVALEKSNLIKALPQDGWAILNYDNKYSREMASLTKAKTIYFGEKEGSDFLARNIKNTLYGLSFNVSYDPLVLEPDENVELGSQSRRLDKEGEIKTLEKAQVKTFDKAQVKKVIKPIKTSIFGEHFVYSILPALIVGMIYKMSFEDIAKVLADFSNLKGRMNMILGVRGSLIIDDSYNANPDSMTEALKGLASLKTKGRKIAALGSMNELGDYTERSHKEVGEKAALVSDVLVTVGELARKFLATEAEKKGLSRSRIFCFSSSREAGQFLRTFIVPNDVILVKGSQNNVRMEWLIKEIMAKPEQARDLLVRQGKEWG